MNINKDLCDICGTCAAVCPKMAITIKEFDVILNSDKCIKCENCVKVCPAQAIKKIKYVPVVHSQSTNTIKGKDYDAIVIGAGPAGSVTARFLAESGCSVLILERDREPGIPVRCAEGVSCKGILPYIDFDEKWICTKIDGARLHSPNGDFVDMYNNGTGFVLDRRVFDRALADIAVSKGAILQTKTDALGLLKDENQNICGVSYRQNENIIHSKCKIVIGADGIESMVGRWAGFNTCLKLSDLETCCQYTVNNIKIEKNLCQFYFGNDVAPGGYLWIFPKSETQANIGIGISGNKALPGMGPKYFLDKYMEKNFPDASINYMVYGGVPTRAGNDFVKDNIMLVGDAAHQVNPITGGGIAQGMIAGQYCGETAALAIKENNTTSKFLSKYTKRWDSHLGKNQKFMYSLKEKFMKFNDKKFNSLVFTCQRIPSNEFNLRRLFQETLKEDPLMLAQLAASFVVSKVK